MSTRASQLLRQLERLKLTFDSRSRRQIERSLKRLGRESIVDAVSLITLHELLLFLRAYPQSTAIVNETESLLREFVRRVQDAAAQDEDLSPLDHPELSGIAGRLVADTFSYYIVRGLVARYPRQVAFFWEWFEDENRLGQSWPRFMPLLEEDAFVEANIPYRSWLRAARGKETELGWLIRRFEKLPIEGAAKAELYDSQKLYVEWTPSYRATRTGMRLPPHLRSTKTFYHREPLLQRRDISFADELSTKSLTLKRLTKREGETVLDLARDASTVRYRELYGFTHGDPARVIKAPLGRGVDLFVTSLPSHARLPLRAYHSAIIFKNQVPVGYFEGLSLFERMESGFNLYYTFREGETAWLYANTLTVMRQLLRVTTFVLDPYQIGFENEEGIESGAFWFYRKLGFRPTAQRLQKLAESEEEKIRQRKNYRTPAGTLRKLAASPMVFELDRKRVGDWDRFQIREIGFAVQREMARRFGSTASEMRSEGVRFAERLLKSSTSHLAEPAKEVFSNFGIILLLIPDIEEWSREEKQMLLRIIQAKASGEESRYLRLMQKHERFRASIINLGSTPND
ncbi:MAG TPA: hypothetical protein VLA93_14125 [Pyrinomonadaceae bacterium]|nr:hypothetical protein [Pyrinomonadaceae bacterium]